MKATNPDSSKGRISRRRFVGGTAVTAAAFTIVPRAVLGGAGQTPPSEKLNLAGIGIGGMGAANLSQCEAENIVALCDVDDGYAAKTFERYPRARRYKDYREMFDRQKDIDAVIIATPDHSHAVIGMEAIRRGKHIYLQKPLAHSIHEARELTKAAQHQGVQTQMGNQGHSSEAIRRMCEWVWDGAIGEIREVHAWSDRPAGGQPWSTFPIQKRPAETPPVPEGMDWDLWLGPAAYRPYHPVYAPLTWRGWLDFGTGALGDMGCHILDPAFWALKLGNPSTVQATTTHYQPEVSRETFPRASIVRYEFPAREDMPPVRLTWYDGHLKPPIPAEFEPGRRLGTNGALLIGNKGMIIHGSHGAGGLRIVPESRMQAYQQPPKTLQRVEGGDGGHERDWVRACKTGKPASSTFNYGGPLTEMVLLGVLAIRLPDRRLEWDGQNLRFPNNDEATALVNPPYRNGWSLRG